MSAYENRKKEQLDRRFKMLFLRKLEIDGQQVKINDADRELLRTYGRIEDYEGEDDLERAVQEETDAL